jgi:hypothetical protein
MIFYFRVHVVGLEFIEAFSNIEIDNFSDIEINEIFFCITEWENMNKVFDLGGLNIFDKVNRFKKELNKMILGLWMRGILWWIKMIL